MSNDPQAGGPNPAGAGEDDASPKPRVDFYLVQRQVPNGRLLAVCRLSHKVYRLGHTALIQMQDAAQAKALDDLMWTFDQGSFVPHDLAGNSAEPSSAPLSIGYETPVKHRHNVLISVLDEVPEYFSLYQRVAEIVDVPQQDRVRARERYRVYREYGCNLETHDI